MWFFTLICVCVGIPTFALMIRGIVEALPDVVVQYVEVEVESEKEPRVVYTPEIITKNVYRDKIVYKDRIVYRDKPVETKEKIKETSKQVMDDVVFGLFNLGHKKSDAKKLVKTACEKKYYATVEDLFQDCIS